MIIYHAHIYFKHDQLGKVQAIHTMAKEFWRGKILGISPLISRPIGPHPLPMFEIDFPDLLLEQMKTWLENNRQDLSVLIHRHIRPELPEHTTHAIWLGDRLELDLTQLDRH